MAIAYFDCSVGAAGDMIVAALIDAGAPLSEVEAELAKLGADPCRLRAETVRRAGIRATKFTVDVTDAGPQHHRKLSEILEMIDGAGIAPRAAGRAKAIFTRLAEAESKVHGIDRQEVHFHEIGALDSIMDIVGACVALELLAIERVYCSPIPVGSGTLQCAHGVLPVPAPATAELLTGARILASPLTGEATTPTGAAVLTTLAEAFGSMPAMSVSVVGCGAGSRETDPLANVLRVFIGQVDPAGAADTVVELSANIDDCTGEVMGETIERLLAAGALDAWATPAFMKKSRPAWVLSALFAEANAARGERIIFTETTTFGVRRRRMTRSKLLRAYETVETPYGPIRIKVGRLGRQEVTASPEFADCRSAAEAHGASVKEVLAAAEAAYRQGPGR